MIIANHPKMMFKLCFKPSKSFADSWPSDLSTHDLSILNSKGFSSDAFIKPAYCQSCISYYPKEGAALIWLVMAINKISVLY